MEANHSGAVEDDLRDVGIGFHVVQNGGLAKQALVRRERRTGTGLAALALDGGHQSGFLAAHESAGAQTDVQIKIEAGAKDVLAQQAVFASLVDGDLQALHRDGIFRADVDIALVSADGVAGDGHGLEHHVGIALQNGTVHERAGVALVSVAADVFLICLGNCRRTAISCRWGSRAPPRPRRPLFLMVSITSSGVISVRHFAQGLVAVESDVLVDVFGVDDAAVAQGHAASASYRSPPRPGPVTASLSSSGTALCSRRVTMRPLRRCSETISGTSSAFTRL